MLRRNFCALPLALVARPALDLAAIERRRVLDAANRDLNEAPLTVTAASSPRSAGGAHDYFSEGDYWWPDPANPSGPYVQKDGLSNPDNFDAHRQALIRLSLIVPTLAAAWRLTSDSRYARQAVRHLRAWFVDPATRMNPQMLYAQAIHGRFSGRGIGIIDTLHLVEVARAACLLNGGDVCRPWFERYLDWMTTHKYGQDERDAKNNHGTCWALQAAEFARLTGNTALRRQLSERFKTVLAPGQFAADGSFPLELARTKPYGYSLFNLDVMAALCQSLSTADDDLWHFQLPDGRSMARQVEFMHPYIVNKSRWPYAKDVMYWADWPVRHPALLFAGLAYDRHDYISTWSGLTPDPTVPEIRRNFPIRQPLLWLAVPKPRPSRRNLTSPVIVN